MEQGRPCCIDGLDGSSVDTSQQLVGEGACDPKHGVDVETMRLVEGVGALASEGANVTGAAVGEGELETRSHELLDVGALHVLVLLDLGNLENVDRGETGTVARSHVLVQRLGSLGTRERTELLVHVVSARARVVSQPHGEVLHLEGLLLVDLWGERNGTKVSMPALPFDSTASRLQHREGCNPIRQAFRRRTSS